MDEEGVGAVDIVNGDLRKALSLTSADLRFADFVLKNIEGAEEEAPGSFSLTGNKIVDALIIRLFA